MNENRTPTEMYQLTVVSATGVKTAQIAPPTELPSDLVPGEFVMIPELNGAQSWYVFCDKQRWWGNGRWNLGGSIHPFDNTTMPEDEMYELRRSLLKQFGWIG